jgi:hypothetical protein
MEWRIVQIKEETGLTIFCNKSHGGAVRRSSNAAETPQKDQGYQITTSRS